MKHLSGKLTYANVIATLALFVALAGGTAFAASQMLPKNSVGPKQLRKGAVTATKLAGSARHALTGAVGPRGPEGPTGPQGPSGAAGPAGGSLPAGVTLRGSVAAGQSDSEKFQNHSVRSAVSFGGYLLPERPVVNIIGPGQPAPAVCPGSPSEPQARPGNLCVYLVALEPAVTVAILDPSQAAANGSSYDSETNVSTQRGDGRVSRTGFMVNVGALVSFEGQAWGTWAVSD
jgi:hypothetical protein